MNQITFEYIKRVIILILLVLFTWSYFYTPPDVYALKYINNAIKYPLQKYSYILPLFSILIYIYFPKIKVPNGSAFYVQFNTVYLPDILGMFFWIVAWFLFFLPDNSAPTFVRYFILLFFGSFALIYVMSAVKYAVSWYLFDKDTFIWSDKNGIDKVSLHDVISIVPYKKELPQWIAPLIILLGRGKPVATGAGLISMSSSPELGMEITTKSGKKIRIMENFLKKNKEFIKSFQELIKRSEL